MSVDGACAEGACAEGPNASRSTVSLHATAQPRHSERPARFRMPRRQDVIGEQDKCFVMMMTPLACVRRGSHSTTLHSCMPCTEKRISPSCKMVLKQMPLECAARQPLGLAALSDGEYAAAYNRAHQTSGPSQAQAEAASATALCCRYMQLDSSHLEALHSTVSIRSTAFCCALMCRMKASETAG